MGADSLDVAVGVLSWRAPRTLERTLSSLDAFRDLVAEIVILVQEGDRDCRDVVARSGFRAVITDTNIGVGPGYKRLLLEASARYFLFLEDDWQLTRRQPRAHLESAIALLEGGQHRVVRLRRIDRPGWPVNSAQIQNRETTHPPWLLESVFWLSNPHRFFPGEIAQVTSLNESFWSARAAHAAWTNNPHLGQREWLVDNIANYCDRGGLEFEGYVDDWWLKQDFSVAHGKGLFSHGRVDGPRYQSPSAWRIAKHFAGIRIRQLGRTVGYRATPDRVS